MSDDEKIDALRKYLHVALKNDVLLETVYTAFKLQKRRGLDIDEAFRKSLWDWLLYNAKNPGRVRISDVIKE